MNEQIKLSIIIPHYNSLQYLQTLLASIPNIPEIQVIVVDDKSTENIEEFEKFRKLCAGTNIEFYDNDGVKSAGTCRNIGIRHALGEWLLFADADDYFLDGFYDAVSKYMNLYYDMVLFSPTSVVIGTKNLSRRHLAIAKIVHDYYENPDRINELALRYLLRGPCSKLIRKAMILENGIWFEEIIAANDLMFSTKCGYAAKKIAADTHIIYCITANEGSLTTQWSEEILDMRLWANLRYYSFLKERLSEEEMKLLQMNRIGRDKILQTLQRGYPLKKIFKVLVEYHKCGVRIWGKDLIIRPWHCLHIVWDTLRIRKRNRNIQRC